MQPESSITDSFHDCVQKTAALCEKASAAVLHFYRDDSPLHVTQKDNNTPLTQADLAAHDILTEGLPAIIDLPVVSEESAKSAHNANYSDYWLIDPIDGTKEFIRRSGEFCICIARITAHRPVFAMIYAPTTGMYWTAGKDQGAYKYEPNGKITRLHCRPVPENPVIITAQYKLSKRFQRYLTDAAGSYRHTRRASALKFCDIAEGKADLYPKISAATSEWDTAAGELLLIEAGGGMRYWGGTVQQYGTRATTLNPPFIAYGANVSDAQLAHYFSVMQQQFAEENRQPLDS